MSDLLNRQYDLYNIHYFGGKLPKFPVQWSKSLLKSKQFYGLLRYDSKTPSNNLIEISAELRRFSQYAAIILLHEMCHVKLRDRPGEFPKNTNKPHSEAWHKEMTRLARKGAFNELW